MGDDVESHRVFWVFPASATVDDLVEISPLSARRRRAYLKPYFEYLAGGSCRICNTGCA